MCNNSCIAFFKPLFHFLPTSIPFYSIVVFLTYVQPLLLYHLLLSGVKNQSQDDSAPSTSFFSLILLQSSSSFVILAFGGLCYPIYQNQKSKPLRTTCILLLLLKLWSLRHGVVIFPPQQESLLLVKKYHHYLLILRLRQLWEIQMVRVVIINNNNNSNTNNDVNANNSSANVSDAVMVKSPSQSSGGCFGRYYGSITDVFYQLTVGPRAKISSYENQSGSFTPMDEYNRPDFRVNYEDAKFFIIKSYSEDDVHESIKYNVWSSTDYGNKKFAVGCPVFLFFSVRE